MKTTQYHFEVFKESFTSYQKQFGLKPGYEVHFVHKTLNDAYAEISTAQEDKKAIVTFGKDWDTKLRPISDAEIRKTALYECIHLLLSRMQWLAHDRYLSEGDVSEEGHNLTIRLVEIIRNMEVKK